MEYPLDMKKHNFTLDFKYRYGRYATTIQPNEENSDILMKVNRELLKK